MKDLKHYFSSPKDSEKSDQSGISEESPKWTAENQSMNGENGLKMKLSFKGKKKKSKKRKKQVSDSSLNGQQDTNVDLTSECNSPEDYSKPARKKRKCVDLTDAADQFSNINPFSLSKKNKNQSADDASNTCTNKNLNNVGKEEREPNCKNRTDIITASNISVSEVKKAGDHSFNKERKKSNVIKQNKINCSQLISECKNEEKSFKNKKKQLKNGKKEESAENSNNSFENNVELVDVTNESVNCSLIYSEDGTIESSSKKRSKKSKKAKKRKKREEDLCTILENSKENQSVNVTYSDSHLDPVNLNNDSQEKITLISDSKNKILNYFNKVDRLPDIPQKVTVLKVEAIIHSPPTGKPKKGRERNKRKVGIKRNLSNDLDLITSEEDSLLENSVSDVKLENGKSWKMRVQFSKQKDIEYVDSETDDSVSSILHTTDIEAMDQKSTKISEGPLEPEEKEMKSGGIKMISEFGKSQCLDEYKKKKIDDDDMEFLSDEMKPLPKPKLSKGDGTLASYFTIKTSTKIHCPVLNKERLMAKKQFLESGVPENMKKMMQCRASEVVLNSPAPFPKHSHVRQKDVMNIVWNLPKLKLPEISSLHDRFGSTQAWSIHVNRLENGKESSEVLRPFSVINNLKKAVKQLKKEAADFPISEWYNELKVMKKNNEGEMWSEKFKPTSLDHFLGNTKNIEKFKNWLENHRGNTKTGLDVSSGDEFATSDDETKKVQSMALLVGPAGSGKTAAVYAIANQLGYQVLELNASCNRAGKRLLLEFSEATQSHKVKVSSNFFGNVKQKKEENEKTLLLIEDADLVFNDYDEGFLSAVNCLATTSKRPVVLIANDENCKHLNKIIPNCQLHLSFSLLEFKKLGCWLRMVGLMEGLKLNEKCSTQLAKASGCDVRQSLLQLQFCFSPSISSQQLVCRSNTTLRSLWEKTADCDMKNRIEILRTKRLLKTLTYIDITSSISEVGIRYWDQNLKDSTCVEEACHPSPDATSVAIVEELTNIASSISPSTDFNQFNMKIDEVKKVLMTGGIEGGIASWALLSRTSVATDYLSAIRRIAVSEQSRLINSTKRNNRYFNYLQTVGLNPSDALLSVLTTTFNPKVHVTNY